MRLLGSRFMLLAALTMLGPALAFGATTNIVVPFFPSPTVNPCNFEQVNVSGDIHIVAGVSTDGSGGLHLRSHINYQGVSGIGAVTGSKYQIPTTINRSVYLGSARTITLTVYGRVIAQGSTPNFSVRQALHVTIDADGVTRVSNSDFQTDCN